MNAIQFIEEHGVEKAREIVEGAALRYEQAKADYEAIYSIPESVRQAILNLEMHL